MTVALKQKEYLELIAERNRLRAQVAALKGPWIILPREGSNIDFGEDESWFIAAKNSGEFIRGYFSKETAHDILAKTEDI